MLRSLVLLCVLCLAVAVMAAPRFLSLPFPTRVAVLQGWNYSDGTVGHAGIDYGTGDGMELRAAADGYAMWAWEPDPPEDGKGYGRFVFIKHDQLDDDGVALFTLYGHMSETAEGIPPRERHKTDYGNWKRVLRGNVIGRSGNTGQSSGPHLHFALFRGGYGGTDLCRDPYGLYQKATSYPDGGGSGLGQDHYWLLNSNGVPALPQEVTAAQLQDVHADVQQGATGSGGSSVHFTWKLPDSFLGALSGFWYRYIDRNGKQVKGWTTRREAVALIDMPGMHKFEVQAVVDGIEGPIATTEFGVPEPACPGGTPYTPVVNAPTLSENRDAVLLSWRPSASPSGKAVKYGCAIFRKSDGGQQWISPWLTDTNSGWRGLPAGEYNWYVAADDGTLQSPRAWGPSFTIGIGDTGIHITSPADGAAIEGRSVTLTWDSGSQNACFYVYHDAKAIAGPFTERTYTERNVHPGTHKYTVWGENANGRTQSDAVRVSLPETGVTITSPSDGAVIEGTTVTLTWVGGPGNMKYNIFHDANKIGETTGNTFTESPVRPGTHRYTVTGRDARNINTDSDRIAVTTVAGGTDLTITSPAEGATVSGPITIAWNAGPGLTRFNIRRDGEKLNSSYIMPATSQSSFTFREPSVRVGQHHYTVIGHDYDGNETRATVNVTVTSARSVSFTSVSGLSLPQSTIVLPAGSPVTLRWSATGGVNCFDVWHDTKKIGNSVNSPFTEVVNNGTHLYKLVGSVNGRGTAYEDFVLVHVGDFHVTLTSASTTGYDVDMSWESSANNTGFFVRRADADGSNVWTSDLLPGSTHSIHLAGEPKGTHIYTVVGMETEYGTAKQDETQTDSATLTIDPKATMTLGATGIGNGVVLVNGVAQSLPFSVTHSLGDTVTLEASPNVNSSFDGWSGDVDGDNNPTSLCMDGDKTVTLSFGMQAYPLSLAKQGAGDGQVAVNGEAHALPFLGVFAYGSAVTVEAIPTTGSAFDRWTGDTTSDARAATVLVTGPSTVGVSFTNLTMHVLPVAPVTAGAPITLEAVAGDDAAHNYKFWAKRSSDSKFTLVRDWAADATCTIWHPVAGAYQLIVQASQPGGKYMESKRIAYTVATALSSLTLGGSPASPTAVDQAVSLLAAATGGLDVEYGFTAQRSGDLTPAFVRDFTLGRRNTIWAPTVAGTYTVTVIARERGTDATRTASLTYVVNPKLSALSLALTSPPSGPTALGVPIGLLATPTGGGTLEYQFLWNYSATTELAATWTKEAYGNGRGYTLKPTQPGFYTFRAYAREKGSTANYQASSADVKVEVKAAVSAYTVTFTPSGSGTVGGPITIAATGIVGGAQPQWKFWARKKGTSTWLLVRDYAAAPVVTDWKPANAGTYDVMVYCREVGSKAPTFDKCATATYVVR